MLIICSCVFLISGMMRMPLHHHGPNHRLTAGKTVYSRNKKSTRQFNPETEDNQNDSDRIIPQKKKTLKMARPPPKQMKSNEDDQFKTAEFNEVDALGVDLPVEIQTSAVSVMGQPQPTVSMYQKPMEVNFSSVNEFDTIRFFKDEGHPLLQMNLKNLTREEVLQLDKYTRKQNDLRPGDTMATQKDLYTVQKKLAEGRFSAIYMVESKERGEMVAVKTELRKPQYKKRLKSEVNCLTVFEKSKDHRNYRLHFARLIDSGRAGNVLFVVTTLFGPNLMRLKSDCGGRFSKPTGLFLCFETFKIIRDLHFFNIIHRDIKPANFCIGNNDKYRRVFVVDFGSAKKYDRANQPKFFKNNIVNGIVNDEHSLTFASSDIHKGEPPCPKTDLEAWFYTCVEILSPIPLPWKNVRNEKRVAEMKEQFLKERGGSQVVEMCTPFPQLLDYINNLRFESIIDYSKLRDWIRTTLISNGGSETMRLDWENLARQ